MDTPVALLIFNRPDTTAQVLAALAVVRPTRLFVIADGPRPGRVDDQARCATTRALIDQIDWPCEIRRHYAQQNLGCGHRPASGISWVFEQVDEAIILEDDCVPHPEFFPFASELLARYRDDERVMMVSGNNFTLGAYQPPASYFFYRHAGMWGWATWRRAWQHHDMRMRQWPALRATPWLDDILLHPQISAYWRNVFDQVYAAAGETDIWDAQWYFAMWSQHGLAIGPRSNLVTNIGFRADATHTTGRGRLADLPVGPIGLPLRHPSVVVRDRAADFATMLNGVPFQVEQPVPPLRRQLRRVLGLLPAPVRSSLLRLRARLAATS